MTVILTTIICFVIGFIISYLVGGKKKESEGKYIPNLVVVADTDILNCTPDTEMCYHIHHWIFLGVLLMGYMILNYIMGYKPTINYLYLFSIYLGASVSEYVFYGNDIFSVYRKCYNNC
jgi:hypothetical protein